MGPMESHRRRITLRRRRRQEESVRRQTREMQERAAIQRQINRQLRGWTPVRILAVGLLVVAAAVAVNHAIAHLGDPWLPMSMGWQDILVGYPTAGVIAMVAFIILGQRRVPK